MFCQFVCMYRYSANGIWLIGGFEFNEAISVNALDDDIHASVIVGISNLVYLSCTANTVHVAFVNKIDAKLKTPLKALSDECFVTGLKNVQGDSRLWEQYKIQRKQTKSHALNFLNRSLIRPQ